MLNIFEKLSFQQVEKILWIMSICPDAFTGVNDRLQKKITAMKNHDNIALQAILEDEEREINDLLAADT
jgi:hypothetical protein